MWRPVSCESHEEASPLADQGVNPRLRAHLGSGRGSPGLKRAAVLGLPLAALAVACLLLGFGLPAGAKRSVKAADVIVAEEVPETSGVSEWEVVWPTGVHVRESRSIYSSALEVKAAKERFRGRQEGSWVELTNKRGYMLITTGEHLLLRRTAAKAPQTLAPSTAAPTTSTAAPTTPTTTTAAPMVTLAPRTFSSSTTAAPATVKELEGHLEWEVTSSKAVFVRMDTSPTALVLGIKAPGTTLVGTREGEQWLRLNDHRGFIHIVEDGVVQVEERSVAYSQVSRASCASAGRFPIQDASICEAAAVTLGLPNQLEVEDLAPFKDAGCFLRPGGSAVSFSMNAAGGLSGAAVNGWLICSSKVSSAPAAGQVAKLVDEEKTARAPATTLARTTTVAPTTTVATTTTEEIRPSLFCWCVAMVHKRAGQVNSEVTLMRNAYGKGVGIFACNMWRVFSDQVVPLGETGGANTTGIPGPPSKLGSIPNLGFEAKMLLNTGVFFRAWDKVLDDKVFARYDWTVKLDPDCVFFPDRLRIHLRQAHYNFWEPIYFNNCQRWNSMQGPIELFSRGAMQKLSAQISECKKSIDRTHIGEDIFMQKCTVQLGMQHRDDWKLLNDQYCMHTDNPCGDGWTVGFHPYKSVDLWNNCYNTAISR